MRIASLTLEQFRSYERLHVPLLADRCHLLLGPNGAGKTNVLEAISILSLTRSFLGAEESDVPMWGREYYRVRAELLSDAGETRTIEVVSQQTPRRQKACFLNDVRVTAGEIVGVLPTVAFLPQDLDLFRGSPAARRTMLDQLLSQVSPEYLQSLSVYQRVLKQRNALLRRLGKGIGSSDDLAVWDDHLAREGSLLTVRRLELMEVLQCTLPQELAALGEDWADATLRYERSGTGRSREEVAAELREALQRTRERDIILCFTSAGPHRHDWQLLAGGRSIETFASRGQQRAALLALLFLQVSYLELQRGEKPVVLLDDVFSELDDKHQDALITSLSGNQVILSATHAPPRIQDVAVWRVESGSLLREPAHV